MNQEVVKTIALILRPNVMEAALELNDSDFKYLITKLYYYSRGEEYEEEPANDNRLVKIIFDMEKSFLDYNLNRFLKINNAKKIR